MNMKTSKKIALLSMLVLSTTGMFAQMENLPSPNPAYAPPEDYKTVKTATSDNHDYYFCFVGDKVGMIDDRERVLIPIEYDEVFHFNKQLDQYLIRKGDNWGLVSAYGNFIIQPLLASIKRLDAETLEVTEHDGSVNHINVGGGWDGDLKILRAYLAQKYEYGKYFIPRIDSTTKAIPVDEFWASGEFHDGLMPVWDKNSKKIGFVNTQGEWVIPYSIKMESKPFTDADAPHFSGGYMVLRQDTGPYNFDYIYRIYDKSGTLLWSMKERQRQNNVTYNHTLSHYVEGGFALEHISYDDVSVFRYVSPTGKELFPAVYAGRRYRYNAKGVDPKRIVRPMRDGMVAFPDFSRARDTRWGFFDKSGKVIVEPIYTQVHDFQEGLAAVQMAQNTENPGKWGFIDKTGKLVIPAKFSNEPLDFSEGLAIVRKTNGNYVYINTRGEVVSPEFDEALPFVKGAAFAKSYTNGQADIFAMDHAFNVVSHYIYDDVFAKFTREQVLEAARHPERPWSGIFYDAINEQNLYTSWGEQFTIYDEKNHKIKISEGVVCISDPFNPDNKYYCDFTGKVIFYFQRNEF